MAERGALMAVALALSPIPGHASQAVPTPDPAVKAEVDARAALAAVPAGSEEHAAAQMMLGSLLQQRGRDREAEPLLRAALDAALRFEGADGPGVAFISARLAVTLIAQDRLDEAERTLRRASSILTATPDAPSYLVASVLMDHGLVLAMLDRHGEAEAVLRRGLALVDGGASGEPLAVAGALMTLAIGLAGQGRYGEAEPMLRRAFALHERNFGRDHFETRKVLVALGMTLRLMGREAEAEPYLRRAVYAHALTGIWDNIEAITAAAVMGDVSRRRNPGEARVFYARAALGVQRRLASHRDFSPAAQAEVRTFVPIFVGQVEAAWWIGAAR